MGKNRDHFICEKDLFDLKSPERLYIYVYRDKLLKGIYVYTYLYVYTCIYVCKYPVTTRTGPFHSKPRNRCKYSILVAYLREIFLHFQGIK